MMVRSAMQTYEIVSLVMEIKKKMRFTNALTQKLLVLIASAVLMDNRCYNIEL